MKIARVQAKDVDDLYSSRQSQRKSRRISFATLAVVFILLSIVQGANAEEFTSKKASSRTEGQLAGANAPFVRFTGKDGLELELTMPKQRLFDYTVMFWFRSHKSLQELRTDETILNKNLRLFELPGAVACSVTRSSAEDPYIVCNTPSDNMKIRMADLPDIQAWMHLTFSANHVDSYGPAQSHCYINVEGIQVKGKYPPMQDRRAYLSSGFDYNDGQGHPDGFSGDYRQFWYAMAYVEQDQIQYLQHEESALDFRVRAYYKFNDPDNPWRDDFRDQHATPVGDQVPQILTELGRIDPFCSSLSAQQVQVPELVGKTEFGFRSLPMYPLRTEQRDFAYTLSLWIRNYGEHTFSTNAREGREKHHMFELADSFALFWDSPISFRVYVYARDNAYEVWSAPVSVPLRDWVNIQVTVTEEGVKVMTFNENGQRLQLMNMDTYLAPQYPKGEMTLFESFTGVIYKLQFWQTRLDLPVLESRASKSDENMLANLNFARLDETKDQWALFDGRFLISATNPNYNLILDQLPSEVSYDPSLIHGTIDSTRTVWNGVSCPNPARNQVYFAGQGAAVQAKVTIDKTEEYTVELWFKPDWSKRAELVEPKQKFTYLFQINDESQPSMVIYFANDELKCAPQGISDRNQLIFTDIKPFEVPRWQHIACTFKKSTYIKGHYLALNLDPEGPLEDFDVYYKAEKTFYKDINAQIKNRPNFDSAVDFNIVIGNVRDLSKIMYGSFKDVRIWAKARSDEEINMHRFVQVIPNEGDRLVANFKLVDGSRSIINAVDESTVNNQNIMVIESDRQNVICPAETFFDRHKQVCVTYPYTVPAMILYTTAKNEKGDGYTMTLTSMVESSILKPGADIKTNIQWTAREPVLSNKALTGLNGETLNFDIKDVENGTPYGFEFVRTDAENHNFYVKKSQTVIPVKCWRVADFVSDEPFTLQKAVLDGNGTTSDMCFKFQVKKIDGCIGFDGKVLADLVITAMPAISDEALRTFTQSYDSSSESFKVCIPAETLQSKQIEKDRPFRLVFTINFIIFGQKAFMNNAYEVAIEREIIPAFNYTERVIDIGNLSKSLYINAAASAFAAPAFNGGDGKLSFRWECGNALKDYCDGWSDSPFIHFNNPQIKNFVNMNQNITISVVVTSAQSGNNPKLGFRKSQKFIWSNQSRPEFNVILLSGSTINVSKTTIFSVDPKNFRLTDKGYTYAFTLEPADQQDVEKIQQSAGQTMLILQPSAMKFNTVYSLTVQVFNDAIDEATPGEQKIEFKTKAAPELNSLEISPSEGVAFTDKFEIKMTNYTSTEEDPITYVLFGVASNNETITFRITPSFQNLDSSGTMIIKMKLPELSAIMIRIQDKDGFTTEIRQKVAVTDPGNNVIELLESLRAEYGNTNRPLFWQYAKLIAFNTNVYTDQGRFTAQKATEVNSWIAKEAALTIEQIPQASVAEEHLSIIRRVVMAIDNISNFKLYNDKETILTNISTAKNVLLRQKAIDKLLEEDLFSDDLIAAIGDLFDLAASAVSEQQSERLRMLEDDDDEAAMRKSLEDLFAMKNSILDLLCRRATASAVLQQYQTASLDLYVQKVAFEGKKYQSDSQFTSSTGGIQVSLPIEGILTEHKVRYPEATEVCFQASFMSQSPIPAIENYDLVEGTFVAHVGTLDNLGNRILQNDGGYKDPRGNAINLYFKVDSEDVSLLNTPQTKCMHIPGGYAGGDNQVWSGEGCEIELVTGTLQASFRCKCDTLKDQNYALVQDRTEKPGPTCPGDPECGPDPNRRQSPDDRDQSYITVTVALLLPLFLMGSCLPFYLRRLDKKDYEKIDGNELKMSRTLLKKFQIARGYQCESEVYFYDRQLHTYLDFEQLTCSNAFAVYKATLHPFLSLLNFYDYRMNRFNRHTLVLGQVSLITILVFMLFSKTGKDLVTDDYSFKKMLYMAAPLTLITIPVPRSWLKCMQTELYVFKDDLQQSNKPDAANCEAELDVVVAPSEVNLDFVDRDIAQVTTDVEAGQRATLLEKQMHCKRAFIVIVYTFWFVAMALCTSFVAFLHETNEEHKFMTFVELSEHDAFFLVGTWYCAVVIGGWGILNLLRLGFIAVVAPGKARAAFAKDRAEAKEGRRTPGDIIKPQDPNSCMTKAIIPVSAVEIALDILFLIEIVEHPNEFEPVNAYDDSEPSEIDDYSKAELKGTAIKNNSIQIELTKINNNKEAEADVVNSSKRDLNDENIDDEDIDSKDMKQDRKSYEDKGRQLMQGQPVPLRSKS